MATAAATSQFTGVDFLDFDSLPRITGNNYRQALAQAPGLVLSEETSPLVSIEGPDLMRSPAARP